MCSLPPKKHLVGGRFCFNVSRVGEYPPISITYLLCVPLTGSGTREAFSVRYPGYVFFYLAIIRNCNLGFALKSWIVVLLGNPQEDTLKPVRVTRFACLWTVISSSCALDSSGGNRECLMIVMASELCSEGHYCWGRPGGRSEKAPGNSK